MFGFRFQLAQIVQSRFGVYLGVVSSCKFFLGLMAHLFEVYLGLVENLLQGVTNTWSHLPTDSRDVLGI